MNIYDFLLVNVCFFFENSSIHYELYKKENLEIFNFILGENVVYVIDNINMYKCYYIYDLGVSNQSYKYLYKDNLIYTALEGIERTNYEPTLFWNCGYVKTPDNLAMITGIMKDGELRSLFRLFSHDFKKYYTFIENGENSWINYSLYLNQKYPLKDILLDYKYPVYGIRNSYWNFGYFDYFMSVLIDYKKAYSNENLRDFVNLNFDFLKYHLSANSFSLKVKVVPEAVSNLWGKKFRELRRILKENIIFSDIPMRTSFNFLINKGYLMSPSLKIENGLRFEILSDVLFSRILIEKIPDSFSLTGQIPLMFKDFFKHFPHYNEYQFSFYDFGEMKSQLYGINRYYPSIYGKVYQPYRCSEKFLEPSISIQPFIDSLFKQVMLRESPELFRTIEIKFSPITDVEEKAKVYLNIYNKLLSYYNKSVDYMKSRSIVKNLHYVVTQDKVSADFYYKLVKSEYPQLDRLNFKEFYDNYFRVWDLYQEDYIDLGVPEDVMMFDHFQLPYMKTIRRVYYMPVKIYSYAEELGTSEKFVEERSYLDYMLLKLDLLNEFRVIDLKRYGRVYFHNIVHLGVYDNYIMSESSKYYDAEKGYSADFMSETLRDRRLYQKQDKSDLEFVFALQVDLEPIWADEPWSIRYLLDESKEVNQYKAWIERTSNKIIVEKLDIEFTKRRLESIVREHLQQFKERKLKFLLESLDNPNLTPIERQDLTSKALWAEVDLMNDESQEMTARARQAEEELLAEQTRDEEMEQQRVMRRLDDMLDSESSSEDWWDDYNEDEK